MLNKVLADRHKDKVMEEESDHLGEERALPVEGSSVPEEIPDTVSDPDSESQEIEGIPNTGKAPVVEVIPDTVAEGIDTVQEEVDAVTLVAESEKSPYLAHVAVVGA